MFEFHITAGDEALRTNVEKRLNILETSSEKNRDASGLADLAQRGREEILQALQPFGYFNPIIKSHFFQKKGQWVIQYNIQLGLPMKIKKVVFHLFGPGKENNTLKNFIKKFPLKSGQIFNVKAYDKAKEDLFNLLNEQGYIKSKIEKNLIEMDTKENYANIILFVQTGIQYRFGPVSFSKTPYSYTFLKRFVNFNSEDHYSSQRLNALQQQLNDSSYFQSAELVPDFDAIEGDQIPIHFLLTPPKSQRYQLGIGYGTLTGPRLLAGANFRRLTDTGHHVDTELRLSSILSGIAAKYYIPGRHPLTDQWVLGAAYQRFAPQSGSSRSGTLSAGYLMKVSQWQLNMGLNYLKEEYKIEEENAETRHLLYPGFSATYLKSDDVLYPRHGLLFNVNVRGASDQLLSSINFLQGEIKTKYLFSPLNNSRIILKADIGYTVAEDIKNLPLSMRFFAGGVNSIRGYKDSSIGPGKYLETGSMEWQQNLHGPWAGAIFYDFGTATNHWGQGLFQGAGAGVIYQSVIGPVKVYIAKGLDKTAPSYSLDFSIGPEF